jgi:ribosomal protein S18 acetylase RimI-like enzyme
MEAVPLALQPPVAPCVIRPVERADVTPLRACCWPERSEMQVQRAVSRAMRLAAQGYGLGVVALAADAVVGFGQLTQWVRAAEISDLIVCEGWRGQGIGTAIIQTLVRHAHAASVAAVEIGGVVDNTRALALYRRLGFRDKRVITLDLSGERTPVQYLELDLAAL